MLPLPSTEQPKDLVLLSVVSRIPPPKDDPKKLRIVCATTSFEDHPEYAPTSKYNRMLLGVSGFIAEKYGENGSKVIQITDLSGVRSPLLTSPSASLSPP